MNEIEIYIMIDNDGNCDCACDEDVAKERYEEGDTGDFRCLIKIKLTVPLVQTIQVPPIHVPEEKLTVEVK